MSEYIRSLLCLSDVHAGSPYAVSDENPILIDAGNEVNEVYPNKGQLKIYERWKYMLKMADKFDVDTVINLADTCDGCNPAEGGRRLMTAEIDAQKDLAIRLLHPLVEGRRFITCTGSVYHQSLDTKIHKDIAHRLENTAEKSEFVGVTSDLVIPEINKRINIAHKASSAMLYTATMADREIIYWNVAEAKKQLPKVDWIIRGHLHKFYHLDTGREHFVQLGCWKTWHPIKNSTKMIGRLQPDIGWTIILFDEEGHSDIKNFIYSAPNIAIKQINL